MDSDKRAVRGRSPTQPLWNTPFGRPSHSVLSQPYPDSVLSLHFSHVLTDRLGNRTQVPQPGLYIGEHYPLSCLSCSYLVVLTGFRPPKRLLWSRELPLTHRASVESLTTNQRSLFWHQCIRFFGRCQWLNFGNDLTAISVAVSIAILTLKIIAESIG